MPERRSSLPIFGRTLAELVALGVQRSIDDFGTTSSSIAYDNRSPLGGIKIDRSFVRAAGCDKGGPAAIRAERDEEVDQLAFPDALNCNKAQGYRFGRPVPLSELSDGARRLTGRISCSGQDPADAAYQAPTPLAKRREGLRGRGGTHACW